MANEILRTASKVFSMHNARNVYRYAEKYKANCAPILRDVATLLAA